MNQWLSERLASRAQPSVAGLWRQNSAPLSLGHTHTSYVRKRELIFVTARASFMIHNNDKLRSYGMMLDYREWSSESVIRAIVVELVIMHTFVCYP
jgi:hypothetical protein